MTRTGGTTPQYWALNGEVSYELAIAISMLFDGFLETDRRITVCGLECEDRLEALQRIFDHEMVHPSRAVVLGPLRLHGGALSGYCRAVVPSPRSHSRSDHTARTGGVGEAASRG
jgi:hypothetical protein